MWGALFDERRICVLFLASSHSWVRVAGGIVSYSRLPPKWKARSAYVTQEQGDPVLPPGTGSPFSTLSATVQVL
jgi:hypothetical protein